MNRAILSAISIFAVGSAAAEQPAHWSFQPLVSPPVADVRAGLRLRNPIDAFIVQRLEQEQIAPAAEAEQRTLMRRVMLDLTGLHPTPVESAEFVHDQRPDAYERLADRLLASRRYAERWTRVWLDLCHYGDTDGHLTDQLRPVAWRYRDWVFESLNADLPFDEFTIRQVAGDLLPAAAKDDPPAVLGTGFLRQTLSNREGGADLEQYRVEQIVDRTNLVGVIWLGLTAGCARCHDHKYDPLTQEDFYRLYAFFDHADEVNIDAPLPGEREAYAKARPEYERRRHEIEGPYNAGLIELQRRWEEKLLHAVTHPGENHVWDRQWELLGLIWGGNLGEGQLEGTEIVTRPWDKRTLREQDDLCDYFLQHGSIIDEKEFMQRKLTELRDKLAALKKELSQAFCTRAPVMRSALTPRQTYIHERGEFRSRGKDVEPGLPAWLPDPGTGQEDPPRVRLARWLVSPHNPLMPRVTVNRMWQEFFGRGIVATSDNFGVRGDLPSHPELLDWLAAEFLRGSWDVKRMHRLIVNSATYRQSARPRPELAQSDPGNVLLARQASLRVPAETIRDMSLAVSGLLCEKLGGPSVFPPQSERVSMEAFGHNGWKPSAGEDRYRRGLYTFIQRTSPFAQAITFDAPSPQKLCTRRDRSNTPLQALTLLNDPVFFEVAGSLAERVMREGGDSDRGRLQYAVKLCLCRPATDAEIERLEKHLVELKKNLAGNQALTETEIWTDVASILLNLHEFVTRD